MLNLLILSAMVSDKLNAIRSSATSIGYLPLEFLESRYYFSGPSCLYFRLY